MKHVLIVEDEAMLRDAFATLFKYEGFTVHEAVNGQEALTFITTQPAPDVIILDVLMPVMDGLEFLKAANIKETAPESKVLVLSNLSDAKTQHSIHKLGADKYLLKAGVSPMELIAAVREMLQATRT